MKGRTEFRPSRADPKKPRGEIKQGVRFQPQIFERGLQNTARTEFSSSRSQRAKGLVSRNEGTPCNLRNRIEQITRNRGSDYKRKRESAKHHLSFSTLLFSTSPHSVVCRRHWFPDPSTYLPTYTTQHDASPHAAATPNTPALHTPLPRAVLSTGTGHLLDRHRAHYALPRSFLASAALEPFWKGGLPSHREGLQTGDQRTATVWFGVRGC